MPIVAKMQGMYWTTSAIALYLIFSRSSGLFVPFFRWMTLRQVYKSLIALDILYAIGTTVYFYNMDLFLYVEATLCVIFPILVETFYINYNVYIIDRYGRKKFEDLSFLNSTTNAVGGALGFGSVIFFEWLLANQAQSVSVFICLFAIYVLFQTLNYVKYFRTMP